MLERFSHRSAFLIKHPESAARAGRAVTSPRWLILFVLLVSVACGGGGAPANDPAEAPPEESPASASETRDAAATPAPDWSGPPPESAFDLNQDLHDAFSFAHLETTYLGFTHWGRIAEYAGVDAEAPNARNDLSVAALRYPVPANALRTNAQAVFDAYGIDQTSLIWEAGYGGPSAPWTVMKLRDSVDLENAIAGFKRNGFEIDDGGDIVTMTHDYDLNLPGAAEGMDNVTILRKEHIMIFGAPDMEAVDAHRQGDTLDDYALSAGMVDAVEVAAGASVHLIGCTPTGPSDTRGHPAYGQMRRQTQAQLRAVGGVQPFLTALFAYDLERGDPRGRLVLTYPEASAAQKDVEPRAELARTGATKDEPFTERFTLNDASADGPYLTLTFGFPDGNPAKLLDVSMAQMPFSVAAC